MPLAKSKRLLTKLHLIFVLRARGSFFLFIQICISYLKRHIRGLYIKILNRHTIYEVHQSQINLIRDSLASNDPSKRLEGFRSLWLITPNKFKREKSILADYFSLLKSDENAAESWFIKKKLGLQCDVLTPISQSLLTNLRQPLESVSLDGWISNRSNGEKILFRPSHPITVNLSPEVGSNQKKYLGEVIVPESSISVCNDVTIIPNFCVVTKDAQLIAHEPAAELKDNRTVAGLWHLYEYLPQSKNQVQFRGELTYTCQIEEGILIGSRCSSNYFHWLIEAMGKFLELSKSDIPSHVPLIVDSQMPFQHYLLLDKMNIERRPIIFLDSLTAALVKKLWLVSIHTNIPDDIEDDYWLSSAVSTEHINFLRERLEIEDTSPGGQVYLSRLNKIQRTVVNEKVLIKELRKNGTQIIFPELLTLEQQIKLFQSSSTIIAPCGAALSNTIFCNANTKLYMILTECAQTFSIFTQIHSIFGPDSYRVLGHPILPRKQCASEQDYIHSPYVVSHETINKLISQLNKQRTS